LPIFAAVLHLANIYRLPNITGGTVSSPWPLEHKPHPHMHIGNPLFQVPYGTRPIHIRKKNMLHTHTGLPIANFEVLNRHHVFRWFWSFYKTMQLDMANVAVTMHLEKKRPDHACGDSNNVTHLSGPRTSNR
jgi:hypothetical protein